MQADRLTDVLYEGVHCRLAGLDAGEFGDVPMQELAKDRSLGRPIELLIDARAVRGASVQVSSEWAQWLGKHRSGFRRISMLTGSRFIQLTAHVVRRFADLGEVMRIYSDPRAFDAALAARLNQAREKKPMAVACE